jgi:hypothetical protein
MNLPRDVTADGPPFRIDAQGVWWHGDGRIERVELVRLFASILVREDDGYWLVNPAERCRVQVADVPYLITSCDRVDTGIACHIALIGETIMLGPDHPLTMHGGKPYVMVRAGCAARVATQAYYQLVDMASEQAGRYVIRSNDTEFDIGDTIQPDEGDIDAAG